MGGPKTMKPARQGDTVRQYLTGTIRTQEGVRAKLGPSIEKAAGLISHSLKGGGKWMLCGNGGSAADAQHLATELVGRLYRLERRGLPAMALTTDSSTLTSVSNDYGFEQIFSRQVEAHARPGDVLMAISTSGRSPNVLAALSSARRLGCATIGLTGSQGGPMQALCDVLLKVPSDKAYHVQEAHIAIGHLCCFLVEKELLDSGHVEARSPSRAGVKKRTAGR
jgi:D-sedoheptulose 7-phosphate isomerase